MWDPFYGFYILIWAKNIEAKGGEGGKLLKTLFMAFREGRDYQSQAQVTYMNYEPTTHLLMYIQYAAKKVFWPVYVREMP